MHSDDLTEILFQQHPIWTWDSETTGYDSVPLTNPLSEDHYPLFVSARFETDTGHVFDGYVQGPYVSFNFGIFIKDQTFIFNANLPKFTEQNIEILSGLLSQKSFKLFPIRYETEFWLRDGAKVAGVLDFR